MRFLTENNKIFNTYYRIYLENVEKQDAISKLSNFLEGGLKPYAADFVEAGEKYNVDPFLTASIAMLETGRGTAPVLTKYKNVSGKYDSGTKTHYAYSNVRDSVYDQARFLRQNYLNRGLTTFNDIGAKYAPAGAANDPKGTNKDWPINVAKFYSQATNGSTQLIAAGQFDPSIIPASGEQETPEPQGPEGALQKITSGLSMIKKAATGT